MPRSNMYVLLVVALVSLVSYQHIQRSRHAGTLVEVFNYIDRRYLEAIPPQKLFEGAVEGMMAGLDEYSAYIGPQVIEEFKQELDQQFGGVGIEVSVDPKTRQITVTSPLVGSPAYEAGVRAGDLILRINGQSTQGLPLQDAARLMRGAAGEPVTLTIQHQGEPKPIEITLVRAVIQLDSVLGDARGPDRAWKFLLEGRDRIGYVRISAFGEKTADELRKAVDGLLADGMRGLVLDLRNNPGGLLESAVEVCDQFLAEGVIVTTRSRGGRIRRSYEATADADYPSFPLAVLVNQYSASAAEIVAACLQDHRRAVVVGQRSWGKGTVQEVLALDEGQGALKLTTASYWRPSGQNIHRPKDADESTAWGVRPDKGLEVIVEGDELARLLRWRLQRDGRRAGTDAKDAYDVDRALTKAADYVAAQKKQ